MKSIFYPDAFFQKVVEISPSFLRERKIRGLILDIDNTLTTHNNPVPSTGVLEWLESMREAGVCLRVLSNNRGRRVAPFAEQLGLPFTADGMKPLPLGIWRACREMGLAVKETAIVGDQLFTDILGGRCSGVFSILVEPIEPEQKGFLAIKRKWEKPILRAYHRMRQKR